MTTDPELTLKNEMLTILNSDKYQPNDVNKLLHPCEILDQDVIIRQYLNQIVSILTRDLNRDKKFSMRDIELLSSDTGAITNLTRCCVMLMCLLPSSEFSINIEEKDVAVLMLKFLYYLFLVIIPRETGIVWMDVEKNMIMDLCNLFYAKIFSSNIIEDVLDKLKRILSNVFFCFPCCQSNEDEINNIFPKSLRKLEQSVIPIKRYIDLENKIAQH